MALHKIGETGDAVRDIQNRLAGLGFDCAPDEPGTFGEATERAVIAFQKERSLAPDGMVGRETWRTLVDAGYSLGDRLLYHTMPMFHGDDVAELQRRLNAIGFDAGDVDGIFGADTLRALLDFQENRRMAEDGIAGPLVVGELDLMSRETDKVGRNQVREKVWLESRGPSLAGLRVVVDPFCRDAHEAAAAWEAATAAADELRLRGAHPVMSRSIDTAPAERLRAQMANERAADLIVGFSHPATDLPGVYYFESAMSRSEAGRDLATAVASGLALDPVGRTIPMLRETRATAIVVTLPHLDEVLGRAVIRAVDAWLAPAES
jgi:N-acetylmuramoyl-L-alanine amidase